MAAMNVKNPHERTNVLGLAPLTDEESAELDELLDLRRRQLASASRLSFLALRAYDTGQRSQKALLEAGGWLNRENLRQLMNRARERISAGREPTRRTRARASAEHTDA